jgi:hypothetical protein
VAVRDLRSLIAHEYAAAGLKAILQSPLTLSHTLLKRIEPTARYLREQLPAIVSGLPACRPPGGEGTQGGAEGDSRPPHSPRRFR